jgi:serine/threonine-protein kinase RsbW
MKSEGGAAAAEEAPAAVLRCEGDHRVQAGIRAFVSARAAELGAPADVLPLLILAVDEAVANVIEHGYRAQAGPVEVEVEGAGRDLLIHIRDEAPVFDPTAAGDPNLDAAVEDRPIGGLGIHLVRQNTDALLHRAREGGGNELTLVKRGLLRESGR